MPSKENHLPALAIDFGTVRIGLAIAHSHLAEPLVILPNDPSFLPEVVKICNRELVKTIVVGLSEHAMADKTKQFAEQLRQSLMDRQDLIYPVQLVFFDETLSSKEAHERLKMVSNLKGRSHIDHYAASIFLQEWLDTTNDDRLSSL